MRAKQTVPDHQYAQRTILILLKTSKMLCFSLQSTGLGAFRPSIRNLSPSHSRCYKSLLNLSARISAVKVSHEYSLEAEIEQAKREGRRLNIDKSKLTPAERQQLRLRSKAIPMVADKEPLDVVFEDDRFLVVNKPSYLRMHPSHRFEGGSLLNRAIGHCGFMPFVVHRLDMVRDDECAKVLSSE